MGLFTPNQSEKKSFSLPLLLGMTRPLFLPFKAYCGEMIDRTNIQCTAEDVQCNATIDRQSDCVPEISNINLQYIIKLQSTM